MKTVMTITGIRPDFIRMSEVFRKLDENFRHVLVHTGQHYDRMLSDIFFEELKIRIPDFNLGVGAHGKRHHEQLADLSVKIIDLIERQNIKPDIILFLGDSNSVVCSVPLKKEGYRIGHIEAGMRSYDRRMLEEINRVVCDHCSDLLFVYHQDYANNCTKEGIPSEQVFVVGNTIVEVCDKFSSFERPKKSDSILMDIHRPENFKCTERMRNVVHFANICADLFEIPVRMIRFSRTVKMIDEAGIDMGKVELVDLMSYKSFLRAQYDALFMISDSGTAQEEPALLGTPVLVPRDFTERPQSINHDCSFMVDINSSGNDSWQDAVKFIRNIQSGHVNIDPEWLGVGQTSNIIVDVLKRELVD